MLGLSRTDPRTRWIVGMIGSFLLSLVGYRLALFFLETSPEIHALQYRRPLEAGTVLTTKDVTITRVFSKEDPASILSPEEKSTIVQVPLVKNVQAGEIARTEHFLPIILEEGFKEHHRAVWIPYGDLPQRFREGSRVDLFNSQGELLAENTVLVSHSEAGSLIAIPRPKIRNVARALASGRVTLSLRYHGDVPKVSRAPKSKINHGAVDLIPP